LNTLVLQERRQRDEIPAPKGNVETFRTLPAPNPAFAIKDEEDLLCLVQCIGIWLPGGNRLDRHRECRRRDRAAQIARVVEPLAPR